MLKQSLSNWLALESCSKVGAGSRDNSHVPQKVSNLACAQFPRNWETGHNKKKTFLFGKKNQNKLSSSLAQPNLRRASLKPDYNKSVNSYN